MYAEALRNTVRKGDTMNLRDYLNVRRVLRTMSAQWNCPVWVVKGIIRRSIQQSWEEAMTNPEQKALCDKYFPKGKPTPDQYILRLGHAHENGEDVPYLFRP